MPDSGVHVLAFQFWLIFAVAVLLLTSIPSARLRAWPWAFVNVAFLSTILSRPHFVIVLGLLLFFFLVVQVVNRPPWMEAARMVAVLFCLGLFLIHKFRALQGPTGPLPEILAAIGFSYVALRMVELLRAVSEGRHRAPNLASTINYLVPFHMLAAGPIQSFEEFASQPEKTPPVTLLQALSYTERIVWGLFKKFVLAYFLQKIYLTGFRVHGWYFLVEVQLFYVWLYLDFSALTDIAVGIGGFLGVQTPENFNHPFLARNIIVFWERWHISLSQFIRRNLYIPIQLALMRRTAGSYPLWCSSVAFTVSFALCGIWHGGTLRFLAWGLLHAMALVVTNLYRNYLARYLGPKGVKRYLANKPIRALATVVTFEFVAFSLAFIQVPI